MFRLTFVLNCLFLSVFSTPSNQKCKLDKACVTKVSSELYKSLFEDESNNLDPIHKKTVTGDLGTLKYTLEDTYTSGYKKCVIKNANLELEKSILEVDMYCPEYHIKGKYEMNGRLGDVPVYGNGDFNVETKAYNIKLKKYLTVTKKNNKHYIHIDSFDIAPEALEGVVINFENLYNGQKDLADKFLKYANENWREVSMFLEGPLFKANYENIIIASNKSLKDHALEEHFEL